MLENGDKQKYDSKYNVRKEEKKYELAYNAKYFIANYLEMQRT